MLSIVETNLVFMHFLRLGEFGRPATSQTDFPLAIPDAEVGKMLRAYLKVHKQKSGIV